MEIFTALGDGGNGGNGGNRDYGKNEGDNDNNYTPIDLG